MVGKTTGNPLMNILENVILIQEEKEILKH